MEPPPAVAVLEVAGAVLEWTVDDASGVDATTITFTDIAAADWLWRLIGAAGHAALVNQIGATAVQDGVTVDLPGLVPSVESLAALRHLAVGHWLRRWWPASVRDGIGSLDRALLDAEIAVATADLQEYFSEDTLDSDVAGLLAPHGRALADILRVGDPRATALVRALVELADDADLGGWSKGPSAQDVSVSSHDDYALAAGGLAVVGNDVIARGVSTVCWTAVPPAVFDAADDTVEWSVQWSPAEVVARIAVATIGSADGVPLRFAAGPITGRGVLDAGGGATLQLVGADGPVTEDQAWAHHWGAAAVSVGADVTETPEVRRRIRDWARSRLSAPGPDSYLAELLAGEADY